jgi:hypothetical protein
MAPSGMNDHQECATPAHQQTSRKNVAVQKTRVEVMQPAQATASLQVFFLVSCPSSPRYSTFLRLSK